MVEVFDKVKTIVCALAKYQNVDSDELTSTVKSKFPITVLRALVLQKNMSSRSLTLMETIEAIEFGIKSEIEIQEEIAKENNSSEWRKRPTLNFLTRSDNRNRSYHNNDRNKRYGRNDDRQGRFEEVRERNKANNDYINRAPTRYERTKECIFCKRNSHSSFDCRNVREIKERISIILNEKRCWICLSNDHNSYNCKEEKCKKCNKAHNTELCFQKEYKRNDYEQRRDYQNVSEQKVQIASGANSEPLTQNFRFTPINPNHQ